MNSANHLKDDKPPSIPLMTYRFSSGVLAQGNQKARSKKQNSQGEPVSYQWIDVVKQYCPEVLKSYPYMDNKKEYDKEVFIIETQITQGQQSKTRQSSWKLFKSKDEVNLMGKKMKKVFNFDNKDNKVEEGGFMAAFLQNLNKASSQENNKQDEQNQLLINDFIQHLLPKDKYNLKVLSQFEVRLVKLKGLRNCLTNTVCGACQRSPNFYVTLTTESILVSEDSIIEGEIEEYIPFTNFLEVEYHSSEVEHKKFTAKINSGRTTYYVAFKELTDLLKFACVLNAAKESSGYFQKHRFNSFCFPREHNIPKFYSDGDHYFSDLHDEIEKAQTKICITGWCITPYFLLKRPQDITTGQSRLDFTLTRAAKRGVKIFIVVYQEPSLLVNNDSYNVFDRFENLHENFKVIRHPGLIIPQLWSHHEKSVIIDEKIAFMGGLDICYGRWDNHNHSIADYGNLWSGADYKNQRKAEITEPRKFKTSNRDRATQSRMPWHDIAVQVRGPIVIDMQRHFVLYWYFALRDLSDDPRDHLRNYNQRYEELKREEHRQNCKEEQEKNKKERTEKLYKQSKPNSEQTAVIEYAYYLQRKDEPEQRDYTFGQRAKAASAAFKDLLQHRVTSSAKEIFIEGFERMAQVGDFKMQLCRSSCEWSTGIKRAEHSIYEAYLQLIDESEEFIYIENQFFMSFENQISERIAQRIKRAYNKKEKFKIIVMMPLMPGFQGDVTQQSSGLLRIQMHLQFQAIKRHEESIYTLLSDIPSLNPRDYIEFFGLRNHAMFGKEGETKFPLTQIIYVHSKMMIVDDRHIIIGSANINDRSLLGTRDSELALVMEDPFGKIGSGKIYEFRAQVFKEHFGMSERNCCNLNSYWGKLVEIGQQNAEIYRTVFGCIPDNTAPRFEDVKRLEKEAKPELYQKKIKNLVGHYVEWPIEFLKDEDLSLKFGQLEYLAPIISFT